MRLRRVARASPGFTLIEMAVALAITGMVVAAGYAGLSVLSDTRSAAGERHRRILGAVNARSTLAQWLRSATDLLETAPRSTGAHPLDEMTFVTADGGELWPGPRRVHLRVDVDPSTPPRGLVATLRRPGGGSGAPVTVSLAPEATGVEIRYRIRRRGEWRWVGRWREEEADRALPTAVRVRLVETARIRIGPGTGGGEVEGDLAELQRLPLVVPLQVSRW